MVLVKTAVQLNFIFPAAVEALGNAEPLKNIDGSIDADFIDLSAELGQ